MTFTTALLTNTAYGYPRGARRRVAPIALACLHVTANPNSPPATAIQERNYANRDGSNGPSAHTYVNRDGTGVHAIDLAYAAWSNGAVRSPKTGTPGIPAVLALVSGGHNANEAYVREVELCGRYSAYPITQAQVEAVAGLIAADSVEFDLPISRATVHLHSDIDTEQRPNCPVPAAQAEAWVAAVISRAQEIRMATIDELLAQLQAAIDALEAERDAAVAAKAAAETERDRLAAKIAAARAALA